jgi:hypothetical protein
MSEYQNPQSDDKSGAEPERKGVSPARVYGYWLTGTEITPADTESAKWALRIIPELRDYAVGTAQFLTRAVRFLSGTGIRQFLYLGAGFPASPTVHEIAQAADPIARVVYAEDDERAVTKTRELLEGHVGATAVKANPRDVSSVLKDAAELLDLGQPTALMFMTCLDNLEDEDDPAGVVRQYLDAAAPGSYVALAHSTQEMAAMRMRLGSELAKRMAGLTFKPRRREQIRELFNGRELVEPGLVQVSRWRPDYPPQPNADRVWAYGGIARL